LNIHGNIIWLNIFWLENIEILSINFSESRKKITAIKHRGGSSTASIMFFIWDLAGE